jgi:hypothetical protein
LGCSAFTSSLARSLELSELFARSNQEAPYGTVCQARKEKKIMVLTISEEEFVEMKMIIMDRDEGEALRLLKEFLKRLEQQKNLGLKSHLD